MNLIDFAAMLDGRENGYPQFSDEELKIAKENNIVIVTGASDDLVELEGAIYDEGDCYEGGKISVKAIPGGGIVNVQMYAVLLLNGVKIRTSMVSLFHGHMTYHLSMKPL